MTFSEPPLWASGLVLIGHGPAGQVRALLEQAAPVLAEALALSWAGFLDAAEPTAALTAQPAGIRALPVDPGQSLAAGGHWAEALGAWRQPVLVLLNADQVEWGLAAASAALLDRERVPLLGLVQWGGAWDGGQRRLEGLPWLGWLAPTPADGGDLEGLVAAIRLRYSLLMAQQA